MNSKKLQACDVTEKRFPEVLKFQRMGGVPINMDNASILYSIYTALTAVNAYSLYLAFYMDIITHNDELKISLRNFQALNSTSVLIGCSRFKVGQMLVFFGSYTLLSSR
jgi:hypothetical protein